jgi:hypothetical protein
LAILLAVAVPLGWAAIVTTPEQTLTFDTLTNTNLSSDTSIITSGYGEFDSGTVHFDGFNWAAGAASRYDSGKLAAGIFLEILTEELLDAGQVFGDQNRITRGIFRSTGA